MTPLINIILGALNAACFGLNLSIWIDHIIEDRHWSTLQWGLFVLFVNASAAIWCFHDALYP